jgi:hypothetical protein
MHHYSFKKGTKEKKSASVSCNRGTRLVDQLILRAKVGK